MLRPVCLPRPPGWLRRGCPRLLRTLSLSLLPDRCRHLPVRVRLDGRTGNLPSSGLAPDKCQQLVRLHVKRDIVGTHPIFVFYSLVDVRDGFARDCPLRHPVLPMLALRDRSRVAPDFLVGFRRFQRSRARRLGGESRRGRGGGRCPRDRLASQVRWSGVLREPCTTDPCQSSGPRRVGFRDGARQVPDRVRWSGLGRRSSRSPASTPTWRVSGGVTALAG